MLSIFKNGEPIAKLFDVKKGADTGDNSKYLRFWWEVKSISFYAFSNSKKWVPYAKGGEFRRWYGNKEYVIYWDNNGYELKHSKANLRSPQMYFKKTITWSAISSGKVVLELMMLWGYLIVQVLQCCLIMTFLTMFWQ